MIELFIPLIAALLIGGFVYDRNQDDTEDSPPPPDPVGATPTDGNDDLSIDSDARGIVDALAGDDTITATGSGISATVYFGPFGGVEWLNETAEPPLTVLGGAGADTINIGGSGVLVNGGAGADTIRLDDARGVVIEAGAQDTVIGQDAEDNLGFGGAGFFSILQGAAVFEGGSTSDDVYASGDGAVVNGGAGNDAMSSFGGAVTFNGGTGNDTLVGNRAASEFDGGQTEFLSDRLGDEVDTLDGGTGDDVLRGSHGDLLTGGAGTDSFLVYSDSGFTSAARITDFDPAAETLSVIFDDFGTITDNDPSLVGRISLGTSAEGDAQILGDGVPLVTLDGLTTARVGLFTESDDTYTRLDGTPATAADFDVVVYKFFNIVT